IPREQFEFQMLFGIRKERQLELVKEGYKMRVYVPYGNDWYGYFMRRLAERPANVAFVLKGMVKK
ncbi:proline dehydrogenase, partial [Xenorhabdus sp. 12]